MAAAGDARRLLERDLHDGAQQRLVALGLGLRAAEACVPDELQPLKEQIAGLATTAAGVSAEVQEISWGPHPAILSRGGLGPALKTLARRAAVPVDLDVHVDQRLPDAVEVGAYYVVAEALTNAAKHARASVVEVSAEATSTTLGLTAHSVDSTWGSRSSACCRSIPVPRFSSREWAPRAQEVVVIHQQAGQCQRP